MTARLEITDGTTVIDLIQTGGNPFFLSSWRPAIIQPKGGGTYQQSSLSDGRRLVDRKFNNATETFDLVVRGFDPDALAAALQDLRMLLDKAVSYWTTNYQDTPVYLIAQADCEEYERYAIIHNWSTPEDENPYAQPFQQGDGQTVVDSWTLIVERGDWLENPPGESTCVEISGSQTVANDTEVIAYPLITNDDCYVSETDGTIALGTGNLLFGNMTAQSRNCGVRFRSVQVPAGATISSAFVRFTSGANDAGTVCNAIVYGERDDEPAAFSTFADFQGRARTTNGIAWNGIAAWTAGNTYDTPDIADIVQEIVNLGAWAQGDDIVIFVEDNGSDNAAFRGPASIDSGVYDEPELHITFGNRVAGRTATCENEVYIANKHNRAQLTDVYVSDGGAFGANLIGAIPPYALLPAVPAVNDAIYFGIDTTLADTGPFNNLVFDISVAQGDLITAWEYSVGAAWSSLATRLHDYTGAVALGTASFSITGVNSVWWRIPSDWTTATHNGVTGYWVRCRVAAIGATPTPPTQQNRDIYTTIWPYIEAAATSVGGNLAALLNLHCEEQSAGSALVSSTTIRRIVAGLRSTSRGENFTACLNAADEQNPAGITVAAGINSAFANLVNSPTGRIIEYTPAGVDALAMRARWELTATISPEYAGQFRTFLRYVTTGTTTSYTTRLVILSSLQNVVITGETMTIDTATTDYGAVELGAFTLPPYLGQAELEDFGSVYLRLDVGSSDGTDNLQIVDLWLMPVDEWAMDVDRSISGQLYARFDSTTDLRRMMRAAVYGTTGNVVETFIARKNGPAILQANVKQRMWFLIFTPITDGFESLIAHGLRFQAYANQRYFSYRGNR